MIENKRTPVYFIRVSITLILVLALLLTDTGSAFAIVAENASTYISEVQVFSGDSLNDAIKNCESAGYIAVKNNINHSGDGDIKDNGIYVVGYKTTTNPDEGITDISLLQMNSGYQDYTYGDVAERAMEKLGNIPTELSDAVNEMAANYSSGSPAAISAVKILNSYHIDELNNIKLGDYIVSGNCGIDFVKKILSRANTSVVSAFCNALAAGVADYGDDNWAERLSASAVKEEVAKGDDDRKLDIQYKVLANELTDSLQAFAEGFNAAAARYEANNGKLEVVNSDESMTEMSDETVENMTTGGEIESSDGDALFLSAYDMLNQYSYDETTRLGDYIVSLGNSSYDDIASLRKIYPLVDSLTDGQLAMMRMCGVAFSAIYLTNSSELIDNAEKQAEAIKEEIRSQIGTDSMSVWIGTDQTVYNQKVAITKDAYRANSAGQIYNTLTSPDGVSTFLSRAQSMVNIAMMVIGMFHCVTYLTTAVISLYASSTSALAGAGMWAICCAGIGTGALGTIFGVLGCAIIVLNYIALAAMIIVLIALLVKYLWDKFTDADAEEFTAIPTVMFDEANNRYVRYDAVNMNGSPANINGDNARRWNALYTTKSKYAGDPICSSQLDDLITVQYNDNATPLGYKSVKCFGEVAAANLNANSKSDSCAVYMFCRTTANVINEGEESETETEENDETEKTEETTVQYISKLSLSVESTETAAKAALTKSGYKVLDVNLTPVTASIKKYTYLGYATTTNPDDAVTDIRISARNTSQSFLFGEASYASCGTTVTGDSLYYTSYKSAGSPILADLLVKYSLDDVPEGYEPINLFCGGNAFNFNVGSEVDNVVERDHRSQTYEHWNDKGVYLYFKPSVAYTDGEEYISGIVLVAGNGDGELGNSAEDYIKALKLQKFDLSLTHAAKLQLPNDVHGPVSNERWAANVETYICYTTTHNPYRAIYGIRSYTSAPGNYSVPAFLGTATNGAYAVCDVMFELPYLVSGGSAPKYYLRGIYETHSYQFASCSGDTTGIEQQTMTTELLPEDYEDVSWSSSNVRGKGIYVLGPVAGGTPLTVDDIQVSSSTEAPEGFVSVQDFKTPNRTEAHNLGYRTNNSKYISSGKSLTPVYIYQKQETPKQKKYISAIYVSTYTLSKAAGENLSEYSDEVKKMINASGNDYCVQNLLSQCTDEIVQANIALDRSQTFYENPSAVSSTASYIGVSRTDSSKEAIMGIIKYVTDKKTVSSTIKVGGVTYIKAGDMIYDSNGSYYLYYTTSAAAKPGMPITDISVSSEVFEGGCATAMSANSVDASDGTKSKLYGDANVSSFIHMSYAPAASTAMGAIYIGHGKTKKEAQANLLSLGCDVCVDMDVNRNTGGEYIYIGYSIYALKTIEIRKGVTKNAVRDIILTVGEPPQSSITVNGVVYSIARDEYTTAADSDGTKAVSLNTGTGGKQIYLYYSMELTKDTTYPLAKLGLACMDYGMVNDDANVWEHVFDINGNRVNLNEEAIATIDDGKHITDNRIYLYVSRTDNAVREERQVDMNALNREFIAYDVYMKGA